MPLVRVEAERKKSVEGKGTDSIGFRGAKANRNNVVGTSTSGRRIVDDLENYI